jgi:hypothetical protein
MRPTFTATLSLWPASPLPTAVAYELRLLGLLTEDLHHLETDTGHITIHRTTDGALGLQITLHDYGYAITALDGLLALLRQGHINYRIWDTNGRGRCFDATTAHERPFTVIGNGVSVITAADLKQVGQHDSTEALLETLARMLTRTTPPFREPLDPERTTIAIRRDDPADDELRPPIP